MTPVTTLARIIAAFYPMLLLPLHSVAQSNGGVVDDIDMVAYDRFGHAVEMRELVVPQ